MKRSEMIEHLKFEIMDIIHEAENRTARDTIGAFCNRKADGLLCMLEGFGMAPPERWRSKDWNERGITYSQWIQEPSKIRTWESENDV